MNMGKPDEMVPELNKDKTTKSPGKRCAVSGVLYPVCCVRCAVSDVRCSVCSKGEFRLESTNVF